jgi:MFS family permease
MRIGRAPDAVSHFAPWYAELDAGHWRVLIASFLGWIFDGYESYALFIVLPMALQSTLTPAELQNSAVWAGIAISATLLGWGLGGLAGSTLADYVGRKQVMMYSVFGYGVFTGLTVLAHTFWAFVFLRFLTGLAMGSEWSTGVTLLAETWPDTARPKGCGILQSGFGWGTLLASLVWFALSALNPLGKETWRLMFVVGALPAFLVLYLRGSIGESERWLTALRERRWAATQSGEPKRRSNQRPFTLTEIFRNRESRRLLFLAFLLSLASTVGWWAISSWLPAFGEQVARASGDRNPTVWGIRCTIVYTLGAVIAYLVSGFIADAIGRRWYLILTYVGSWVFTALTYLWCRSTSALLPLVFANGFFTLGCAYSWLAIYPVELFTTSVRSTAVGFIFNATRLVAWIFPIAAGTMIQFFGEIRQAVMVLSSVYLLGLVIPYFLPETRGKALPR